MALRKVKAGKTDTYDESGTYQLNGDRLTLTKEWNPTSSGAHISSENSIVRWISRDKFITKSEPSDPDPSTFTFTRR